MLVSYHTFGICPTGIVSFKTGVFVMGWPFDAKQAVDILILFAPQCPQGINLKGEAYAE